MNNNVKTLEAFGFEVKAEADSLGRMALSVYRDGQWLCFLEEAESLLEEWFTNK